MKSLTKRIGALAIVVAMLLTLIIGSGLIIDGFVLAENSDDHSYKYYYNQLSRDTLAENFYKAFETLWINGEFKKGQIQYDLIANNVATSDQVAAYVNGTNDKLAESYGAGRDAFYLDHPDLFYADVFDTSISAGQDKSGEYVAYLDSSRVLTTYRGNLDSEKKINNAISQYESAIAAIVDGAKGKNVVEQIKYVNNYIIEHNTYGFGTKLEGNRYVDTDKAAFVYTSYGALVKNESVCEGYAKSFKAVMDRLNIPCVLVLGYVNNQTSGKYEPHSWNYVQVDDQWYMVDPTYNSTFNNFWMLRGGETMVDKYIEDNVVSSSGYEIRYPAVKPYDYGTDADENGMTVVGTYREKNDIKYLDLEVSYDGKGALVLEKEGKYLAQRYGTSDGKGGIVWGAWMNIVATNEALKINFDGDSFIITDTSTIAEGLVGEYIQYVLIGRGPDSLGDMFTGEALVSYDSAKLTEKDFLTSPTTPYHNNTYGSREPSPGAISVSPSNTADLPVDKTYDIKIVYSDKLQLADVATLNDIGIEFVASRENELAHEKAKLTNFKWDEDRTITFTFTPSKMYVHNMAIYEFTPVNLVGVKSGKTPDPVKYSFKGKSVVCSKVFNDGRLYMNVFGSPNILSNSDLSVTDFQDNNGNYYAESQRSQLMLVASKTNETETMNNMLKDEMGVQNGDIVSSTTYEIDLQICGVVPKVPNGSFMQVSFGFPEGYDANDKGTTFKIYHYKHDDAGNITGVEEIPAIITEYGLIAQVKSFSPFTIAQIKNTSAAVQNSKSVNIFANVNGDKGGTVTADGKSGILAVEGDSITYDIKPDNGFVVGTVRLNGKVIDAKAYANGKLTLAKSDIDSSNMLEVTFVNEQIAKEYSKMGFGIYGDYKSNTAGIVIGIVVAVVVLAGAGFAAWWFLIKNKKQPAKATNASSKKSVSTKNPTSAKSTSAAATKSTAKSTSSKAKTTKSKSTSDKKSK